MAVAAVMMTIKMQDDNLEMTQLQARKLGASELFVYNMGVQKHVSGISGNIPDPGDYPKVYTGVDWLKNAQCSDPTLPRTPDYVPCSFLQNSGGRTTLGAMSFVTTIDYDASSGYTARTVLSQMAGSAADETNGGVLGMAALVASGAFVGSEGGSGGSILYCPDLDPMPAGMAAICGVERDQIVMIANANGMTDPWLRIDHGNMMQHVIEMADGPAVTPATDADLQSIHPSMRQIRNVARIYNVGSGNENLYLGNRNGASAVYGAAGSPTTLADNAVIIDADQEIIGRLKVQGNIEAEGNIASQGNVTARGNIVSDGSITAYNSIVSTAGNAQINGWITATNGNITASSGNISANSGSIFANNGYIRSRHFIDSDNGAYYLNPASTSVLNGINVQGRLNMNGSAQINAIASPGAGCSPNGTLARTSAGQIMSCVSGRWRAPSSRVVVSNPFNIAHSGTNTSAHPMIVTVQSNPSNPDGNASVVNACGRRMAVDETPYKASMSAAVVPSGCTYSVSVYRGTPYRVYGQYIMVQ